jgi:hypothetical protein
MSWWRGGRRGEDYPTRTPAQEHVITVPARELTPAQPPQPSPESQPVDNAPTRSAGEPLAGGERAQLEVGFQEDLADVRVHKDADAGQLAIGFGANALTVGRDIYFAPGAYSSALLAHEVTHVLQQRRATAVIAGENAALESQAEAASTAVMAGDVTEIPATPSVPVMQRQAVPGMYHYRLLPSDSLTLDQYVVDDAHLSTDQIRQLDAFAARLASLLATAPDSIVTIEGFADSPGTESHNQSLGLQRANMVRDYLVGKGVDSGRLQVGSGGEGSPVIGTRSYEPRNRRVAIEVFKRSFFGGVRLLDPPTPPGLAAPKQRVDLTYHPELHIPTPGEELQENLRRVDRALKEAAEHERAHPGTSLADATGRVLRDAARRLGLPKWVQDRAESLGKDLPSKGADAVIDQIAGDGRMDASYKNALQAAIRALSQMKVP